jgi:hypothetical protein
MVRFRIWSVHVLYMAWKLNPYSYSYSYKCRVIPPYSLNMVENIACYMLMSVRCEKKKS